MDKQNEVYLYNRTLLRRKKEQTTDICSNVDEAQSHYIKRKKTDTRDYILNDSIYMKCLEKANI